MPSMRTNWRLSLVFAAPLILAAAPWVEAVRALNAMDVRVGAIAYRLKTAGLAHCRAQAPQSGLTLHTIGQYAPDARRDLARELGLDARAAVVGVAPGSPAERAGLQAGDRIAAINGTALESPPSPRADYSALAVQLDMLDSALAAGPARLDVDRAGERRAVVLRPVPGCASRIDLVPSGKRNAKADGAIVQLTIAVVAETVDDDELSFILAHELAHNILGHRARLDAEGRRTANIRATEIEADTLAVPLMRSAGFDPHAAARFWARFGRKTGAGIFSDGTHLRTKARVELLERLAASAPAQ